MPESIVMVALSPTMQDGMIAQWLVAEGQSLKPGDALCEIETDKATMPYESPRSGVLLKIIKTAGQKAMVGEAIAVIGKEGEDWNAALQVSPSTVSNAPPPVPASEKPVPQAMPRNQTVSAAEFPALGPITPAAHAPGYPASMPPSSPLARKMAKERGLDLRAVTGTGPRGRVVSRDILSTDTKSPPTGAPSLAQTVYTSPSNASMAGERVPLSKMRSIIAERLGSSWAHAPHFFVRAAVDMENLLDLRSAVNKGRERALGLNSFIIRIVATALKKHPVINASWEGDAIRYLPSADIGLAVALEGGLITPVVRSCGQKGVEAIDTELVDLVARARTGTLDPAEYTEASFTISNLGSFGVEEFTAIINPPGSAILALGAIAQEAVVRDGAIVARRTMRITLSSDHRVIDGAVAAAFIAELKSLLEEPGRALL